MRRQPECVYRTPAAPAPGELAPIGLPVADGPFVDNDPASSSRLGIITPPGGRSYPPVLETRGAPPTLPHFPLMHSKQTLAVHPVAYPGVSAPRVHLRPICLHAATKSLCLAADAGVEGTTAKMASAVKAIRRIGSFMEEEKSNIIFSSNLTLVSYSWSVLTNPRFSSLMTFCNALFFSPATKYLPRTGFAQALSSHPRPASAVALRERAIVIIAHWDFCIFA
jgi:hypothetical protein